MYNTWPSPLHKRKILSQTQINCSYIPLQKFQLILFQLNQNQLHTNWLNTVNFGPCDFLICLNFSANFIDLGTNWRCCWCRWCTPANVILPKTGIQAAQERLQRKHIEQGWQGAALVNESGENKGIWSYPDSLSLSACLQNSNAGAKARLESDHEQNSIQETMLLNFCQHFLWLCAPNEGYLGSSNPLQDKSVQGI